MEKPAGRVRLLKGRVGSVCWAAAECHRHSRATKATQIFILADSGRIVRVCAETRPFVSYYELSILFINRLRNVQHRVPCHLCIQIPGTLSMFPNGMMRPLHYQQPWSQRCMVAVTPLLVQPLPRLSHFTPSRAPRSQLICRAAGMSSATYNEQMKAAMGWEKADPFEYHYERYAVLGTKCTRDQYPLML